MGKTRMNEQGVSRVFNFPGLASTPIDTATPPRESWVLRAACWLGLTMRQPEHPRGWTLNPATVTLALMVAGMLTVGGYYWGENVTERRHLLERIQVAEDAAARADQKAGYAAGLRDKAEQHGTNTNGGH